MTLALRAYSAATKLKEEEDFFSMAEDSAPPAPARKAARQDQMFSEPQENVNDEFFAPELTVEDMKSKGQASPDEPKSSANAKALVPFHSLKGRMNSDLLKALTFKPFNLIAMSEVQKRVLSRMPELAGGQTQKSLKDQETPEESAAREEREKRGREDLLVKAKTGTGKTIAFLVPGIEARVHQIDNLVTAPDDEGNIRSLSGQGQERRLVTRSHVGTLVISPTRELATQIANEALKLLTWQKENQVQLLVGGESRMGQLRNWGSIRRGRKDVVVATPGRLRDLLSEPVVRDAIATTDVLVLDEADTLLDMGFSDDLNFILEHLPKKRQTMLFSATVSPRIEKIAHQFLDRNHSFIDCVPKNESNVHMHIPQHVTVLDSAEDQLPHLVRLIAQDQLDNKNSSKVIVFLPTTKQTMLTATLLREMSSSLPNSLRVHEIHSRLNQNQRTRASERFRRDTGNSVLVTSDVSARGVDYPGVTRVIQVGIPSSPEQYVHRVGRTGRGGVVGGRGDLILQPFEAGFQRQLSKFPITQVPVKEFAADLEKQAAESPAAARIAKIDEKVEGLLPSLDPQAVDDVFMSLLGYYLGKTDMVGLPHNAVFEGLKDWSTGAGGLAAPPHVSQMMLTRLGLAQKSSSRGGGRGGGRGGNFGRDGDRGGRSSFGMNRSGDRDGGRPSFGGDRGGFSRDRPQRSFGDRDGGDRPPRSFGDRDGGDRPRRSFGGDRDGGDRPRRSFGGSRDDGDRPRRSFGGARDDGDRPRRSFGGDRTGSGGSHRLPRLDSDN